jgi:hypothetical protein
MMKNEVGGACLHVWGREEVHTGYWWGDLRKGTAWKTQA